MFSRDPKHYRPTPRNMNDAFGPYSGKLSDIDEREAIRTERIAVAICTVLAIVVGVLLAYRG